MGFLSLGPFSKRPLMIQDIHFETKVIPRCMSLSLTPNDFVGWVLCASIFRHVWCFCIECEYVCVLKITKMAINVWSKKGSVCVCTFGTVFWPLFWRGVRHVISCILCAMFLQDMMFIWGVKLLILREKLLMEVTTELHLPIH